MASAELNASALGPRYAPDDPTLPKPWKGLIDGSTGNLYYWNPETNVTQYERPAPPQPQVPAGPVPATSMPQAASLQAAQQLQSNGLLAQQGQPMTQASQSLLQQEQQGNQFLQQPAQSTFQQSSTFMPQVAQQQVSQTSQSGLQQSSQLGQMPLQPGNYTPPQLAMQMMQHQQQQMMPQALQQMQRQFPQQGQQQFGLQMPQQSGQQMPQQAVQQSQQQPGPKMLQHQGSQMAHPPVNHALHQQIQPMAYQQSLPPEQPDLRKQAPSNSSPAQSFQVQQDYRASIPKREDADFQQANQVGFSPPHFQQRSSSSTQNLPAGSNFGQVQQMGAHVGQGQQFGGFPTNNQQLQYMGQSQQPGADLAKQHHGPAFQNQISPMMHAQQSNVPSVGLGMRNEENFHGRPGNEYQYNASKEGPGPSPQRPKLAPIPMVRNMQDIAMGPGPPQNVLPGQAAGFNAPPGHMMHNMYGHASGGPPFANPALARPPYMGPMEVPLLTPVEAYRQQHEVTATGDNVPAPFMSFETAGFPPELLREMHSAGFTSPTPIQAQTWPIALQSRDIVAIAKTGSGKTLGYLIPAFMLLRRRQNNPQNGPTVLVLAPTRELATQIQDEAIKFGRSSRVSCTCLYGGAPKGPQLKELDRGADIVVATPGRLNDILEGKQIDLRQVSLLVLDEADRMLDMGFEPQIRKIVNEIPSRRQTLMYTATWPKEVRKIASDLLINPVQVNIGSVDELAANKSITQYVEVVPQMEKQRRLEQILRSQERGSKVIIFCSTKRLCDQLARGIARTFGAVAIHGDKSQGERDWVLNQFRSGKSPILVATDVAARGLDIKDIRVVINYDFPTGIEDYVHRIGRTGRAGATGVSYTFFSEQDWKYAADLIKVLEGANQNVPPEIREMASRGGAGFGKDRGRISRFDSGGGGGRWDSGGRGGVRDGNFGGRGGMRDGNFGGRGGMRDGGFGGRGGGRDSFGTRGGRSDFFPGRGSGGRGSGGRGFGGPGNNIGWGRSDRGPNDRYNSMDGRGGFGRGRGRGRFSSRRDFPDRERGRSYSRSPDMVRTWGRSRSRSSSRSRSRSRGRSRSWTRSRSRSRSRSWSRDRRRSYSRSRSQSRSRSPRRSRSQSRGRSHSRSCSRGDSYTRSRSPRRSYDRYDKAHEPSFDRKDAAFPASEVPPESLTSPIPQGSHSNELPETVPLGALPVAANTIVPLGAGEDMHQAVGEP